MTTRSRPAAEDDHVDTLLVGGIAIVATVVVVAWLRDAFREGTGLHIPTPRRDGIDPGTIAAVRRLKHR